MSRGSLFYCSPWDRTLIIDRICLNSPTDPQFSTPSYAETFARDNRLLFIDRSNPSRVRIIIPDDPRALRRTNEAAAKRRRVVDEEHAPSLDYITQLLMKT